MPAHIPEDDARQLFQENQDHSWKGLLTVLEHSLSTTHGIANNIILMLMPVVRKFEQSGKPYPNTFDEFTRVIDQEMAKEYAP